LRFRVCHAGHSPRTRCVCSFMRSPTISAISCARWRRRSRSARKCEPRPLCRLPDGRGRHRTASSKRFCGSSRSYGRSHHQRQRETFDVMHSSATDRRSASKCQGKWPDQTLDQTFGLPEVLVAVSTSRLSCERAGKTRTLMSVWDSSGEARICSEGRRTSSGGSCGSWV